MTTENLGSKYWDLFEVRIDETVEAINKGEMPPLRRLSLHITNKCNMKCSYCNEVHTPKQLGEGLFLTLLEEYEAMGGGVLHITGGEPSCVPYLWDVLAEAGTYKNVDIHVNTNLITDIPEAALKNIKRLKVSLDSHDAEYFNALVGVPNSHETVMKNLKLINDLNAKGEGPIVSLTFTMTKQNYTHIPDFLEMYYRELPNIYAVFFSAYKGTTGHFAFDDNVVQDLFDNIVPKMNEIMEANGDTESKFLFHASHEKQTFDQETRFYENGYMPCYLQLSELCVNEDGSVANCSHLYRDGVGNTDLNLHDTTLPKAFRLAKKDYGFKPLHEKCKYGCNKKLVTFNKCVHENLN